MTYNFPDYKTSIKTPVRPFTQEELDYAAEGLANGEVDYDAVEREKVFKDEVIAALAAHEEKLDIITSTAGATTARIAYQHAQITADMLDSSDDPVGTPVVRSVLTTTSQSAYAFNWWHAGGASLAYTVQLNAGGGVPAIKVVINPDHMGSDMIHMTPVGGSMVPESEIVARPYNAAGTQLQFGVYRSLASRWEFYPEEILIEGATLYLSQVLPLVNIL